MPLPLNAGFAAIVLASLGTYAIADISAGRHDMSHAAGAQSGSDVSTAPPKLPGQDAFGAIQEVLAILDADPGTDWSKVNLAALREHLIDMNEVTLHAQATEKKLANGVEVAVTGEGRTLDAIRRMVLAQARQLNRMPMWSAASEPVSDGVRLVVTTADASQVARLQALGFIGLMAQGSHHPAHHLIIARGERIE
jgi:hypothetical protein